MFLLSLNIAVLLNIIFCSITERYILRVIIACLWLLLFVFFFDGIFSSHRFMLSLGETLFYDT